MFFLRGNDPGQHDWTPTKSLISNFKKRVSDGGYEYKLGAIRQVAPLLLKAINPKSFAEITLVPIPPSKKIGDPEYDDRMWNVILGMLRLMGKESRVSGYLNKTSRNSQLQFFQSRPPNAVLKFILWSGSLVVYSGVNPTDYYSEKVL